LGRAAEGASGRKPGLLTRSPCGGAAGGLDVGSIDDAGLETDGASSRLLPRESSIIGPLTNIDMVQQQYVEDIRTIQLDLRNYRDQ
jgi:hypothetical protein